MQLDRGQRIKLGDLLRAPDALQFDVELAVDGPALTIDFACFGLDASGRLSDDRYMTFFNQPNSPCGGVMLTGTGAGVANLHFDMARLPSSVERLVLTATIDGPGAMRQIAGGHVRLLQGGQLVGQFVFFGADFQEERALMLAECYLKDGAWRFAATGQGFNGGLDALVRHFGAIVEDGPVPVPVPATRSAPDAVQRVSLDKRIEAEAPQLVSLVKQATVSLTKAGLGQHRAKVCLCLDISGSMKSLYKSGQIQAFAERVLALACRFDDDGEIDVFLFGAKVHQPAPMNLSNWRGYIERVLQRHPLEGDTRYGLAMQAIRAFYFPQNRQDGSKKPIGQLMTSHLPVYVMFLTDGSTSDQGLTERQVLASSAEPIFWQFMGIGKGRKSKSKKLALFSLSDFPFLERLDELPGRLLDNANFFSVVSPDEHQDSTLYDLMMEEYPGWVRLAADKGLLR